MTQNSSAPHYPPPALPTKTLDPPAIYVPTIRSVALDPEHPVHSTTEPATSAPSLLRKARPRSNSAQNEPVSSHKSTPSQTLVPFARLDIDSPNARGRSSSAQPPTSRDGLAPSTNSPRVVSSPTLRPSSRGSGSPPRLGREKLRRSWLPGSRSRDSSKDTGKGGAQAWVMSIDNTNAEYNTALLLRAEKIPELWVESGNLLVYLQSRESGCGPSFKVSDATVRSSLVLVGLIHSLSSPTGGRSRAGSAGVRETLQLDDRFCPPGSPDSGSTSSMDSHLYIPPPLPTAHGEFSATADNPSDIERLVAIRNLFAFLTGQPLVATKAHPTMFAAFLQISHLLEEYRFSDYSGASFGEEVDLSFGFYIRTMGLADLRASRERTVEALVLGERMRSRELYNEAFAHTVGKFSAVMALRSPLYSTVSRYTQQRLGRAHLDLVKRQHGVNEVLEQFEFPSLFAGVANSTSIEKFHQVRFKHWKNSFLRMRSFVFGFYKTRFGNWPPKASSRKNTFSESGLNRLVLKALYADMCALYDLLADRTSLSPRVQGTRPAEEDVKDGLDTMFLALRRILTESDNSSPPVLPPIPFDVPTIPSMTSIVANFDAMAPKEQARLERKLKEHELRLVLEKSYDYYTHTAWAANSFLSEFKEFEFRESKGCTSADLADHRIGTWLFLYAVIQTLPKLVTDAPGLMYTEGVEYFLCQPSIGNPPWISSTQEMHKTWFSVANGETETFVELPADSVAFSYEATYHRSHCWQAAKIWESALASGEPIPPAQEEGLPDLNPPPPFSFHNAEDAGIGSSMPPPFPSNNTTGGPSPPLSASQYPATRRGSEQSLEPRPWNRPSNRSSVVLGIEPVSFDGELPPSISHIRSMSMGPRPAEQTHQRVASTGNLRAPPESQLRPPPSTGKTFDDILGESMPKPKKKKSFFII